MYAFRNKHTDIKVWDAITGEALFAMVHAGPVYRVEWNADQSRIMTMGLPESKEELVAELEEEYPATFGLEEMIQMLDALALQTTVFIWDSASGELLFELKHPEPQVHDVRWSRDGTRVLTSAGIDLVGPFAALLVEAFTSGMEGSDTQPEIDMDKFQGRSAIRVWNTITGDIEFEIVQDSTIELDAWSPDETQIITDSMQGPLTIWDVASGDPVMELAHRGGVIEAEWEPTGTRILGWTQEPADCGLTDCTYGWLVWDATSGELILERYMSGPYNKSRVWNPDKTLAALQINESEYWSDCAGDACQHTVYILDSLGNEQLQLGHTNTVLQIQWNTSGTRLLTSEMDGMIRLWEVPLIRSD